ncbi:GntR family transcriptional regulator [Deinococcus altitudinis]|uniref:GntR family transcriptional regulator n=1 Tax=Deinococcus altitudinis TaxID=468914 RepID=UPI0038925AE2
MLQPLPSVRVVDQVRESLRGAILTGELPPGSRLSVPDLARRLNVSRSPVREAVLQLVAEGLAVEHQRRGAEVVRVDYADLREIYAVRAPLEGLAARLCAVHMNAAELTALRGVLDAQGAPAVLKDARRYRELDLRFHELILQGSHNARLKRSAELLMVEARLAVSLLGDDPEHFDLSYTEHRAVVAALRERDAPAAEQAMRDHLERIGNSVGDRAPPPGT